MDESSGTLARQKALEAAHYTQINNDTNNNFRSLPGRIDFAEEAAMDQILWSVYDTIHPEVQSPPCNPRSWQTPIWAWTPPRGTSRGKQELTDIPMSHTVKNPQSVPVLDLQYQKDPINSHGYILYFRLISYLGFYNHIRNQLLPTEIPSYAVVDMH